MSLRHAQLKRELESIEEEYVDHGVSAEQWKKIEETQRALAEGKMATRPAREVMAEIFEKYDNA